MEMQHQYYHRKRSSNTSSQSASSTTTFNRVFRKNSLYSKIDTMGAKEF